MMSCGGTTGSASPVYISSLPPRALNALEVHDIALMTGGLRLDEVDVAIPVERAPVPVRIVEDEIPEQPDAHGLARIR